MWRLGNSTIETVARASECAGIRHIVRLSFQRAGAVVSQAPNTKEHEGDVDAENSSSDGWSAARIEEEIVVTETGHEVITRFPAEKLMVAGAHYFTVDGPLETTREHEAPPSKRVKEMVAASAKIEGVASTD